METFDATSALTALFLWLIFSYFSNFINCDLQHMLKTHNVWRHVLLLMSFFYLFTLLDASNKANVATIFAKTLIVYAIFIMLTKSKAYYVIPVLLLLMVVQALKRQRDLGDAAGDPVRKEARDKAFQTAEMVLTLGIAALAVAGMLHYMVLQRRQHRGDFSLVTFFFSTNESACKTH
jgi:hypothetical protein